MSSRIRLRSTRLEALLADSKLSQNAWALRLGVSKAYLSQLVSGQRRYPSRLLRQRLLRAFDVPFEELFEQVEPPLPKPLAAPRPPDMTRTLRWRRWEARLIRHAPVSQERTPMLDSLGRDLLYAIRGLRRSPAFTVAAVTTLALAIGINTSLFSAVHAVLVTPLPYPAPAQLVRVWSSSPEGGWLRGAISPQNAFDLRTQNTTFAEMGTYTRRSGNLANGGRPRSVEFVLVTPSLLRALATPPLHGRLFEERENDPGADGSVLISERLWSTVFGRQPDIVGEVLTLDGRQLTVAGVMPAHFSFPRADTDLWKPYGMTVDDGGPRGSSWVYAAGRIREGVSLEQAQADVERVARHLEEVYPDANLNRSVFLEPLHAAETRQVRDALLMLWGAVGLILLIACVNVANLLLARSASRRREFSVRSVLGAGPRRLLQQLLLECLVLASAATGVGLLVSLAGNRVLLWLAADRLPRADQIGLSWQVAAFAVGLTLLTTVLFGLAPAIHSARLRLADALRDRVLGSRGRVRLALVGAQVCLALVLLTGAGLLIRSLDTLLSVELGFDPTELYTFRVEPPMLASSAGRTLEEFRTVFEAEREQTAQFYDQLLGSLETIPGVVSAAAINRRPLSGNMWQTRVAVEGRPIARPQDMLPATARNVTPGYFAALGVPLHRGRSFTDRDRRGMPTVAVINRAMADAYWPDGDPVGSRISYNPEAEDFWMEIVGVVDDVRHVHLAVSPIPVLYLPLQQARFGFFGDWGMDVLLRTDGPTPDLATRVESVVAQVSPELPMAGFQAMETALAGNAADQRFNVQLLGLFAALAVGLAFVGIYGVIGYLAVQRRQEFGIRAALGARPTHVVGLVVRQTAWITGIGVTTGVVASVMLSRYVSSLLYEISPTDPPTLAATAAVMVGVGVLAGLLPAWRASKTDALEVLRTAD